MALPGEFAAAEACQAHAITLEPGERVLLYSYGVMEGRCPAGTEFGLERQTSFTSRRWRRENSPARSCAC